MENTTLVIMAAGIGSRFGGGIKQLTSFGPGGEIIMDYSIYDAIEAGFNKVVFVTRKDMYQDFQEIIGERISKVIPVEYAFQEMNDLPAGFTVPEGRVKPWGTGQGDPCLPRNCQRTVWQSSMLMTIMARTHSARYTTTFSLQNRQTITDTTSVWPDLF